MTQILKGRVAACLPANIDTDIIYPGRYLNITDREQTATHLFELAYPEMRARIQPGECLVAGRNFGCGSSREQAAAAMKYAGVAVVIAPSFARIFFRNSINLGLPLVVSQQAVEHVREGDQLELDLAGGVVRNRTRTETYIAAPLDPRAIELIEAGGLVPYLKRKRVPRESHV